MRTRVLGQYGARAHDRRLRRVGDRRALEVRLGAGRRRRIGRRHPPCARARRELGGHRSRHTGSATPRRSSGARWQPYRTGEDVYVFTKCGRKLVRAARRGDRERPAARVDPRRVRAEPAPPRSRAHRPVPGPLAGLDDGHPLEESWGDDGGARRRGKVRWIGVSNFDVEQLERCEAIRHVDSVQPPALACSRGARRRPSSRGPRTTAPA